MRRKLDDTRGLVRSEAVMMGLGRALGREYAHDLVYDLCRESVKTGRPLLELLEAHPEIRQHADRAALARMLDPSAADHELLAEIENRDNIFPEIDYRVYRS
jgi:3-carboxy-cis,cis-muconate cycloisomerase